MTDLYFSKPAIFSTIFIHNFTLFAKNLPCQNPDKPLYYKALWNFCNGVQLGLTHSDHKKHYTIWYGAFLYYVVEMTIRPAFNAS
mgnify:CR=1 FL=1